MEQKKLTDDELAEYLAELDNWEKRGQKIHKHFKFKNFIEPLKFVNQVGKSAEKLNHHPDIRLGWGYVEFFITTHDAGGITAKDFVLAEEIDALFQKGYGGGKK